MKDSLLQNFFRELNKRVKIQLEEDAKFIKDPYLRIGLRGKRSPRGKPTKQVYDTIIKKFLKKHDCYRTYRMDDMKALQIINFDLDTLHEGEEEK